MNRREFFDKAVRQNLHLALYGCLRPRIVDRRRILDITKHVHFHDILLTDIRSVGVHVDNIFDCLGAHFLCHREVCSNTLTGFPNLFGDGGVRTSRAFLLREHLLNGRGQVDNLRREVGK